MSKKTSKQKICQIIIRALEKKERRKEKEGTTTCRTDNLDRIGGEGLTEKTVSEHRASRSEGEIHVADGPGGKSVPPYTKETSAKSLRWECA